MQQNFLRHPDLMTQYPVIIITRDRLDSLEQLVLWLENVGQENIWFCDNASTYPPLVDYLKSSPHHVRFNEINFGHRAPWLSGLVTNSVLTHFIVTDPDVVPCDDCPLDALDVFAKVLTDHSEIDKVGFGLRIDDLPDHYEHAESVRVWESQFWTNTYIPGSISHLSIPLLPCIARGESSKCQITSRGTAICGSTLTVVPKFGEPERRAHLLS